MRTVARANVALWILQALLALFFAGASGAPKLLLPASDLPMPIPLPQPFVWFIGTCEVLGGIGLILPWATGVMPRLTVIAALCLTTLTVCAATYQLIGGQPPNVMFALVVGALAASVAYGRGRLLPRRASSTYAARAARLVA